MTRSRDFLRSLLASLLSLAGYWLLEWRDRLEDEPVKAGGTD